MGWFRNFNDVIFLFGELSMKSIIAAVIASMFVFGTAFAADTATTIDPKECDTKIAQCGEDKDCVAKLVAQGCKAPESK